MPVVRVRTARIVAKTPATGQPRALLREIAFGCVERLRQEGGNEVIALRIGEFERPDDGGAKRADIVLESVHLSGPVCFSIT